MEFPEKFKKGIFQLRVFGSLNLFSFSKVVFRIIFLEAESYVIFLTLISALLRRVVAARQRGGSSHRIGRTLSLSVFFFPSSGGGLTSSNTWRSLGANRRSKSPVMTATGYVVFWLLHTTPVFSVMEHMQFIVPQVE